MHNPSNYLKDYARLLSLVQTPELAEFHPPATTATQTTVPKMTAVAKTAGAEIMAAAAAQEAVQKAVQHVQVWPRTAPHRILKRFT